VRTIILIAGVLLIASAARAQSSDDPDVRYDTLRTDPFPGYENANFIVNWYHNEGLSWGERFSSEIIVVDSLLIVDFSSPGATDYHHVSYLRKSILTDAQREALKKRLHDAQLRQLRVGIPSPTFSGSGQDVLLVRDGKNQLVGGRVFGTVGSDEDTLPEYDGITIGGNLDTVFGALSHLFPMHDTLEGLMYAGHDLPDTIEGKPLAAYASPRDSEYLWLMDADTLVGDARDRAAVADTVHVLRILQRALSARANERAFALAMVTQVLEEHIASIPTETPADLFQIIANDPRYFFHYFATEPWLQFGQIDDWAEVISEGFATDPTRGATSKAEYDAAEAKLESIIQKGVAGASGETRAQADTFIDRLRDLKHNIEAQM
jgi:hypothetical protein